MRLNITLAAAAAVALAGVPAVAQNLAFSNQTAAAGIQSTYKPGSFPSSEYIGPGACGDFDDDGWQDLFLLSGGQSNGPDKLYLNQQDGTFQDRAAQWNLTAVHRGTGIAVGDYDNDGLLDTYVCSVGVTGSAQAGQNKLYRNVAGASFVDLAFSAGVTGASTDPYGASFGDYDLDGHLDLFVSGFYSHKNRLYRNLGNGSFTDVTTSSGLAAAGLGTIFSFASRFADLDGDRFPELLAVGDFGSTRYFRNNGNGTFSNQTGSSGAGKEENGMGQAVGDFNRDGRLDWYVTSIFDDTPSQNWTGNKLYRNVAAHSYAEYSQSAGVNDGGYGWAAVAADFDHDRWLDIAETNGAAWSPEWTNERVYLWRNRGDDTFAEVSLAAGLNNVELTRGLVLFDYDLDGDQDLLILATNKPAELWRNDLTPGATRHWLRVTLDAAGAAGVAPNGYGAVVRVTAGGVQQTGHVFGGDNFQSQNELATHFGLGTQSMVSELRVEWPDGLVSILNNVAADQHVSVSRSPWTDLGGGIAGTFGPVTLSGAGPLTAGSGTTLSLQGATPNGSGLLFLGVAPLTAPLFGGIFWPQPQVQIAFPTDASGGLNLAGPWPAGIPSGLSIYLQAWFADPGGTFGAAASNGLRATPP